MTTTNSQHDRTRRLNLIHELETAVSLLEMGLALLQRSRLYTSPRFAYMSLLASGLERLLKVILVLNTIKPSGPTKAPNPYPTKRELKAWGHNLLPLLDEIVTSCFTTAYLRYPFAVKDQDFLLHDPYLARLIALLAAFGDTDRYVFLDATAEPQNARDWPDQLWDQLEAEQAPDFALLFSQGQDAEAKRQAVTGMVILIETLVRALARLFRRADLGKDGREISEIVEGFARMDDKNLGTRVYEL